MATRKGIIQLAHEDLAITARFATERMEAHEIDEAPEVVRWDRETDSPVIRQRYVKPGHEEIEGEPALPSGTVGYRYVNEDGEEVPDERIVYVQRTPDGETERVEERPVAVEDARADYKISDFYLICHCLIPSRSLETTRGWFTIACRWTVMLPTRIGHNRMAKACWSTSVYADNWAEEEFQR